MIGKPAFVLFSFSCPDGLLSSVFGLLQYEETSGVYDRRGWETHYVFRGQRATVVIASQEAHSRQFCLEVASWLMSGRADYRIRNLDTTR